MSNLMRLDECCRIELSSIDKKSKPGEKSVKLCNFTDVYYNWNIYASMIDGFMEATASDNNIKIFSLEKGDVVITKDSETRDDIGMAALVYEKLPNTVLGYHCALIRPKEMIDGAYLNAYLNSNIGRKHFENQASGSGQRYTLTKEGLGSIKIPVLPIEQQRRIGSIFSEIDKKIRTNNQINSQLESLAKTIYDYWFLQFEFPNEEGKPYKSSGGKMVWNDELKREIPKGWEVGNLINNPLCSVIKNGVDYFDTKNYLPTANINGETITDGDYITYENRESRANMQPTKFSVWFAKMKNSVKHLSIANNGDWFVNKYILSTGFEGLQCDKQSFSYIHSLINSTYFEAHKDTLAHGATQESVNDEDLKNIKFVVPNKKVLDKYASIVNPLLEIKFSNFKQNQELESLRDFLLPMLMNGQVTFKDKEDAN